MGGVYLEDIRRLYEMYSKDIYKYIYSITLNKEIAQDIVQNTFLEAIKSINTFNGNSTVKTWLIGIAKYEYYAYLRKNPKSVSLDEIEFKKVSYIQDNNESYYTIMNEISKLDEIQRQIAVLRIVNDLSFKEIGNIIGKSENYCRVSFFRIKQNLSEVLKHE